MDDTALNIKWNNHDREIAYGVEVLRSNTLYSDVTLACGGKLYPVHKFLLGTCSDYFSQMFTSPTTQSITLNNFIVLIADIQQYELECILNFMYMGEMQVVESSLPNVIRAAKKLQVKGLGSLEQCLGENTPPPYGVQVSNTPAQSAAYTPQESPNSQDARNVSNPSDYEDAFSVSVPQDFVTSILGDGSSSTPTANPGSVKTAATQKRRKKDELPRLVPAQALLREPLPPHANRRLDTLGPPVRVGYVSNPYTTQMPHPSLTNSLVAATTSVTEANPKIRVAAFARMEEEASASGAAMMRPPLVYMGHRYGIPQSTLRSRTHASLAAQGNAMAAQGNAMAAQGSAMPRLISQGNGMQGMVSQQGNVLQPSGLQPMGVQGSNISGMQNMVVQGSGMQGSALSGMAPQGNGMPVILSYGSALASMASQVASGGHVDMLANRMGQAGVHPQNNGMSGMLPQRSRSSSIGSQGSRTAAMNAQAGRVPGMGSLGGGAIGMLPQGTSSMSMLPQTNVAVGMLPQGGGSSSVMPQGSGQTPVPQVGGVHTQASGSISTPSQIIGSTGIFIPTSVSVTQTSGSSSALTQTSAAITQSSGSGTTVPVVSQTHTQVSTASQLPQGSGQGNTRMPGSSPVVSVVNASTGAVTQTNKPSAGVQQGSTQVPSTSQRPTGIVPLGSEPPGIVLEGLGCMTEIILDEENQHANVEGEPHEIILQGQGSGPPHVVSQRNGPSGPLSQEVGYRLTASTPDGNNSSLFIPGNFSPGLMLHGSVPPSVFGIDIDQIPVEMITGKKKRKRDPNKASKRKMKVDGEKSPTKSKTKRRKQVFPPSKKTEEEQIMMAILKSKHENLKECHVKLDRLHICGPCGLSFKMISEYKNHYRVHHGEEPPGMMSPEKETSVSNKQGDKVGKSPKTGKSQSGGETPRKAAAATVLGSNVTITKGKEIGQEMQIVIEKVMSRADKEGGEDLHMEVVEQTEIDDFGQRVAGRKTGGTEITIERASGQQYTFELSNRPGIHTGSEGIPKPNSENLRKKEILHVPNMPLEEATLEMHCTIEDETTSGIEASPGHEPSEDPKRENNVSQTLRLGSQSTGSLKDKELSQQAKVVAGGKHTLTKILTEEESRQERLNRKGSMGRETVPSHPDTTEKEPISDDQTTLAMECSEEPSPMEKVDTEKRQAELITRTTQRIPSSGDFSTSMGSLLLGDSSGLESTVESELGPGSELNKRNELTNEASPRSRVEQNVSQTQDSDLNKLKIALTSGL
ncbi:uncharacterized protein LOC143017870 [Oratosquilla oratoria]|uniref:uncharacterized protein LOC143017870 n=1 Tax=Oratosquilla oratoria TaxID=337810 RepID=UPI003F76BA93